MKLFWDNLLGITKFQLCILMCNCDPKAQLQACLVGCYHNPRIVSVSIYDAQYVVYSSAFLIILDERLTSFLKNCYRSDTFTNLLGNKLLHEDIYNPGMCPL